MIANRHLKTLASPMASCDIKAREYDDLINLSLGDPDFTTDETIINAAFKDALDGHTHYTDFLGDESLRKAICNDNTPPVPLSQCMITASGCHAMWLVLETLLDEGDEVIIPAPYFTPYPAQVRAARGTPVFHNTYEHENFYINIDRLEQLITSKTKAIILNTPNNPTGACLPLGLMKEIASLAKKYDLLIIADDIYTAFQYETPFIPMATLYEKTITIGSFSKNYCMTGWRVGYVLAPKLVIDMMQLINENNVFTAPSISQRAALFAINNKQTIQEKLYTAFKNRMTYAYERLQNIQGLSVLKPEGSIYLFVNIKETQLNGTTFTDLLLEKTHVLVLPGVTFGEHYEDYIRIAVTVDIEKLKLAFDRIEALGGNYV